MSIIPVRQNSSFLSDSVKKSNYRAVKDAKGNTRESDLGVEAVLSDLKVYVVELDKLLLEAGLAEDERNKKTDPFHAAIHHLTVGEFGGGIGMPKKDIRPGRAEANEKSSSNPIRSGMFMHSSNDNYRKCMMSFFAMKGTLEKYSKMIEDSKKDLNGKRNLFSGKLELKNQAIVDRMRKITSAK